MIDTHCHLTDERLIGQTETVLTRARGAGVEEIIVPATSLEDARKVVELVGKFDDVYGLVGIHPEEVTNYKLQVTNLERDLTKLIDSSNKIAGIGEIGLDFHYDKEKKTKAKQTAIFLGQMEAAMKLELPVAIHCRKASQEIKEVFEEMGQLPRGQFHCFGEDEAFLSYILDRGFYVSFCGNITYKSAGSLRGLVRLVPLNRLLLETDSPYLAPGDGRGSINEPANVKILAGYIAKLLDVETETLVSQTTENARCLYFAS